MAIKMAGGKVQQWGNYRGILKYSKYMGFKPKRRQSAALFTIWSPGHIWI